MATASRSLATALHKGALRSRLAPPYTTSRDVTAYLPLCYILITAGTLLPRAGNVQALR
jgi:hypothetical protein